MRIECDFLVIGTGVAGLTFARSVAGRGRVLLLTKLEAEESATVHAQGGVAAVTSDFMRSTMVDQGTADPRGKGDEEMIKGARTNRLGASPCR